MNYFTQQSIELANQRNYLDLLFNVYPLSPDTIREIPKDIWSSVEYNFNNRNNVELFKNLLSLDLFPIKDGYVPFFRLDKDAVYRNPETVNRICGRIYEQGLDKIYEKCTQPKETNRQMGSLFSRWVKSGVLGTMPVVEEVFISSNNNAILLGSDAALADFARRKLGYTRDKGLDFLARFNGKYIIGEAKFISDEGGHQNDQFLDAMATLQTPVNEDVIPIAILDGVLYIESKKKMFRAVTSKDVNVMSSLLLRDFLYSI